MFKKERGIKEDKSRQYPIKRSPLQSFMDFYYLGSFSSFPQRLMMNEKDYKEGS